MPYTKDGRRAEGPLASGENARCLGLLTVDIIAVDLEMAGTDDYVGH